MTRLAAAQADSAATDGSAALQAASAGAEAEPDDGGGVYRTRRFAWTVLILSFGAALAAVLLRGGAVESFLLAVLGVVMLVSGTAPAIALAGMTVSRKLPGGPFRDGDDIAAELTIRRSFLVPLAWAAVTDEADNVSAMDGGRRTARFAAFPLLRRETAITYAIRSAGRGCYRFGEVTVTAGDAFGLTVMSRTFPCAGEAVVWPAHIEAGMDLAAHAGARPEENVAAMRAAAVQGDMPQRDSGAEGGAVRRAGLGPDSRPYREGDSLRAVDWKAAAKGRGLLTKLYEPEQPAETVVILDHSAGAYEGDELLFDVCAAWAARAVTDAADMGASVRLLPERHQADGEREAERAVGAKGLPNGLARPQGGCTGAGRAVGATGLPDGLGRLQGAGTLAERSGGAEGLPDGHGRPQGAGTRTERARGVESLLDRLAELRADGAGTLAGRTASAGSFPEGGTVLCITPDWQNGGGLEELSALAAEKGCRLKIYLVTKQKVPSFAMRERQRRLERLGTETEWLPYPDDRDRAPRGKEGDVRDAKPI